MKYLLVIKLIRLYPFESSKYPTNRHSWLWGYKAFLFSVGILAQAFEQKNPKMGQLWLVPTPRFERRHTINMLMRDPILDVECTFYSLIPKLWWQSLSLHHVGCHLLQWPVLSLSNTILMWCVRDRILHLNTCIFTILNELILHILTTIFRSEDLEFPPKLVLNQGSKDLEDAKNFRLVLKEVDPTIPGKLIYEGKWIFVFNDGHMREWTINFTVD